MGVYDEADVYELIGIYMLYLIGKNTIQKILESRERQISRIQKCKKSSFRKNEKTITIFV